MVNFILPVTLSNKWGGEDERLLLQRDAFIRFAPGSTIIVVAPKVEVPAVRKLIQTERLRYVFISEETLIKWPHSWKWYRQQQIKLAAHAICAGTYVATLDSDIIPARTLREEDFFSPEGKALVDLQPRHIAPWQSCEWMIQTATLLNYPVFEECWPVTPCVYANEVLLHAEAMFRKVLLHERTGWSEHAVYHYAAVHSELFDKLHQRTSKPFCNFIDSIGALKEEDFAEDAPPFLCASSHRGFSPVYMRKKLESLGVV